VAAWISARPRPRDGYPQPSATDSPDDRPANRRCTVYDAGDAEAGCCFRTDLAAGRRAQRRRSRSPALQQCRQEAWPPACCPEPDWPALHHEFKRKHVTSILWDEYIEQHPEGFRYSVDRRQRMTPLWSGVSTHRSPGARTISTPQTSANTSVNDPAPHAREGSDLDADFVSRRRHKRHAARAMKEEPSGTPCRRRSQTTMSCFGQKPRW
jgi:hypothetical protein